jgi:hypothetical protein
MLLWHIIFGLLLTIVNGEDNSTGYPFDPYLQYRPSPARSLPIQILLTGIVLTLTTVLFIHLLFTAQYHWPLAPVNYALQMSGVTTLLITLIATLCVILSFALAESQKWPYMLSYIQVYVPPLDGMPSDENAWLPAERATWLAMNATTSGLIQITHIQFLTLLYPSRVEKRLIHCILGPMAVLAAVMQLIPIQSNPEINLAASSVRNVCNATLSLLFTAALVFWGAFVNRRGAWRTDGGTAAFGTAALALAVVSTALNFLYIPSAEEYVWLPPLMWAVILWQSFLGWWWWVGAGSGAEAAVTAIKRKEKKEKRRKERIEKKQHTNRKAMRVWKGVASTFHTGACRTEGNGAEEQDTDRESRLDPTTIPLDSPSDLRRSSLDSSPRSTSSVRQRRRHDDTSECSDSCCDEDSSDTTTSTPPRFVPATVYHWFASLRYAHFTATRKQTAERLERLRELERTGAAPRRPAVGWGLGSFGWRINRDQEDPTEPSIELEPVSTSNTSGDRDRDRYEGGHDQELRRRAERRRDERSRSVFWWGPLHKWRLQDSAVY